jgi:class 3 adenylate cyclase
LAAALAGKGGEEAIDIAENGIRFLTNALAPLETMVQAHRDTAGRLQRMNAMLQATIAERTGDLEQRNRELRALNRMFQEHLQQHSAVAQAYQGLLQRLRGHLAEVMPAVATRQDASAPLMKLVDQLRALMNWAESHAAPDGTVTILFSDIEGSTTMTERLGDIRAQEVLRAHNAIIRQQVAAHGGFEVKSMGDGFMVSFSSARRALQCAIAIQRTLATYNNEHPEQPISVRIGLHTGEAIREAEDFFGKNVILASRIAAQAQGGQILVSALLKELTESAGDIRFGEERETALKGLAGLTRVYPVVWE